MARLAIIALSFILCSLSQAASEVYNIAASSTDLCDVPCVTLSQFVIGTEMNHYLHSDITMVFLPGTHYLNVSFSLSYLHSLTMKSKSTAAQIVCMGRSHMTFRRFQNVQIANLEFTGCAGNHIEDTERFELVNTIFKQGGTALELIDTMAAKILNSTFISNNAARGALFSQRSKIEIEASMFYNNTASGVSFGGVLSSYGSTVTLTTSEFDQSSASYGGAIYVLFSNLTIEACTFQNNSAKSHGSVLYTDLSNVTIDASEFDGNGALSGNLLFYNSNVTIKKSHHIKGRATHGAGLYSHQSDVRIEASYFANNIAANEGGGLYSLRSNIMIKGTKFIHNRAISCGAALYSYRSNITLKTSKAENNTAHVGVVCSTSSNIKIEASVLDNNMGGVMRSSDGNISIKTSQFHKNIGGVLTMRSRESISIAASEFIENSATEYGGDGGVLVCTLCSNISITGCKFSKNTAIQKGGALYFHLSNVRMGDCDFTNNNSTTGSAFYAIYSSIVVQHGSFLVANNTARKDATIYLITSNFLSKNSTLLFSHNLGSLMAFKSNVTFTSHNVLFVNSQPQISIQEGGAMTLLQSNAFFNDFCRLERNHAENGGAILSIDSKIFVKGDVSIAQNKVSESGGGVYLLNSELNLQEHSKFVLFNNTAAHRGGGLHAISSSIESISAYSDPYYTGAQLIFTRNKAKLGGGMSMEANAKVHILKYNEIYLYSKLLNDDSNTITFTANKADYGGGLYVDDATYSGTCANSSRRYCLFQVLAMYNTFFDFHLHLKLQAIHFLQNRANKLGSSVYGGLLDRCAVSQFAEVNHDRDYTTKSGGISYFRLISNTTYTDISVSSLPIKVCLCSNEHINCTDKHHIEVKKGETFTVTIVTVDQIGQVINGTIQASLNFSESGLAEGQLTRDIPAECTDLMFNVVSPHSSEQLILYASDGPCKDAEPSTRKIEIHFLPCSCPIGFQVSRMNDTNCTCECHSDIKQYTEYCDSYTGSFVKTSQSRAWISYINNTRFTGFLVYSNCPYDYCNSLCLPINLNEPDGADAQCAFNHSSLLCGSCQPGLSISLGSSLCLSCPSYWPALLIAVTITGFLAGIAMVVFLLALNMTVAIGTLNGLIFYANILYANKSLLLQHQEINFMTVFVSWLNLDLGIDTCYFPGMNTYIKTWLHLVFPAYIFLLVVLVIIISSYSSKFSNLIGKKDPVAVLATLILISYAKLLQVCFQSLSVGILVYPDGTSAKVWLPDATVKYLSGKHIPLFAVAVLILLLGLVYTSILFSWQWLLYLPTWKHFRYQKLKTFIETYHTPYTPRHRYWTGLLLIARIVLYLVAAVNVSNNPHISLTAITFTMCCIVLLRVFIDGRVCRKWPVDVLEIFFYLHLMFLSIFIWYSLSDSKISQKAVSYTSVIVASIIVLLIILGHIFTYTAVFSKIKTTKIGRKINTIFTENAEQKPKTKLQNIPQDDDIHRFNELLDIIDRPVNTNDYQAELRQKPVVPTQSVVEIHRPNLAPSDQEETNSSSMTESTGVQIETDC